MAKRSIKKYDIQVEAKPEFIEQHSDRELDRYVFSYTITITNIGTEGAKLIMRNWTVVDGAEHTHTVRGEGVVGEQPHLKPGEWFQYTSGVVLEYPAGSMQGHYEMVGDDGFEFNVPIPKFILSAPRTIH